MATILFVDTVGMSCWRISILQQSEAILSTSAAFVRTTTTCHPPPMMVAIGLLGDEADQYHSVTTRWSRLAEPARDTAFPALPVSRGRDVGVGSAWRLP